MVQNILARVITCDVGGRFSRCPAHAIDTCQYCARPFCDEHTYHREGYDAVCLRKDCRAKHDDLQAHLVFKERARLLNSEGLCGMEACGPNTRYECALCRAAYCDAHLQSRLYPFREGRIVIEKPAPVCNRCWSRRKLWRK
jgi:hypothetical protein